MDGASCTVWTPVIVQGTEEKEQLKDLSLKEIIPIKQGKTDSTAQGESYWAKNYPEDFWKCGEKIIVGSPSVQKSFPHRHHCFKGA